MSQAVAGEVPLFDSTTQVRLAMALSREAAVGYRPERLPAHARRRLAVARYQIAALFVASLAEAFADGPGADEETASFPTGTDEEKASRDTDLALAETAEEATSLLAKATEVVGGFSGPVPLGMPGETAFELAVKAGLAAAIRGASWQGAAMVAIEEYFENL